MDQTRYGTTVPPYLLRLQRVSRPSTKGTKKLHYLKMQQYGDDTLECTRN